ncbi:response regulator [Ectothiorhodospira mobilis]|uniref:response regulator n=1 Tax=Ectothiorhodospira mobilis TaxID=195064 RepID=UPI0023790129|nr:response regulator [Ectothiorhodospira mobilis]
MNTPAGTPAAREGAGGVLVVDDSRVMRQALKKILGPVYHVHEAADGEAAWEVLQAQTDIGCVFTDLSMPRLDGYGLLQRIRESGEARLQRLPVVVITGNEDDTATRTRAASCGADDVVMKPFRAGQILDTAGRLLSAPAAPGEVAKPAAASPGQAPAAGGDTGGDAGEEAAQLREQLERAREQVRAGTQERARLERELEQLRSELMLRQQTSDEAEAGRRIRALESRLQEAEAGREGLQAELQEASERLMDTDRQVREATRARQEAEAEVQRLHRELDSARERTGAAERALAASDGRAPERPQGELQARAEAAELARLQVEDELVQALSRVERAEQERETARQETRDLRARFNRLQRQMQEREAQEAERRRALEAELARAREEAQADRGGQDGGTPAPSGEGQAAAPPRDDAGAPPGEARADGGAAPAPPRPAATASPVARWEVERARKLRLRRGIAWGTAALALSLAAFFLGGRLL